MTDPTPNPTRPDLKVARLEYSLANAAYTEARKDAQHATAAAARAFQRLRAAEAQLTDTENRT